MAHPFQKSFIEGVQLRHPEFFVNKRVLDCGSLDINGNNRWAFKECQYEGVDIIEGPNVDTVSRVHKLGFMYNESFDVVISTEMLEHDEYWRESIKRMYAMVKPGGMLLITAGGTGRPEHGTYKANPSASPGTNEFYENMNASKLIEALPTNYLRDLFSTSAVHDHFQDFQFYGIKKKA